MDRQSTKSKVAEAEYRSKIASQHLGQSEFFPNEPKSAEFRQILAKRIKEADRTFKNLAQRKIELSPFLEIGAEYALASTLLVNKYKAFGIAADISPTSLLHAQKFARLFKFKKLPKTICADAYHLPFKSRSFSFVFVWETLHHFPSPKPPLAEIKRVLAPNGILLIGAEPIKAYFQLQLWRRPTKLRFWEKILKMTLILPFISHIGKTEVEHGILEEAFPLETWQESLSIFDQVEAQITIPYLNLKKVIEKGQNKKRSFASQKWTKLNLPMRLLLAVTGGGIQAVCAQNQGPPLKRSFASQKRASVTHLICVDCKINRNQEIELENKSSNTLFCQKCQRQYQSVGRVPILLERGLQEKISEVLLRKSEVLLRKML